MFTHQNSIGSDDFSHIPSYSLVISATDESNHSYSSTSDICNNNKDKRTTCSPAWHADCSR